MPPGSGVSGIGLGSSTVAVGCPRKVPRHEAGPGERGAVLAGAVFTPPLYQADPHANAIETYLVALLWLVNKWRGSCLF